MKSTIACQRERYFVNYCPSLFLKFPNKKPKQFTKNKANKMELIEKTIFIFFCYIYMLQKMLGVAFGCGP